MSSNAANWFVERHLTEGRAEKIAFREVYANGRELSYGALVEQSGNVTAL